jgi:hypothetical protein
LEEAAEREARKMPILINNLDNKVLEREYKHGLKEGFQEGEPTVIRRLIEKRFGASRIGRRNIWLPTPRVSKTS